MTKTDAPNPKAPLPGDPALDDGLGSGGGPGGKIRVDKWLWHARFFKTRSLAAKMVTGGHLKVNSAKVAKPSFGVGPDDTLKFTQARDARVIKIVGIGTRRGPACEAQALYSDLTPQKDKIPHAPRYEGKGRPTKKDRRNADLSLRRALE